MAAMIHASCPTQPSSGSITPTSTRRIHAKNLMERTKLAKRGTCVRSCTKIKSREMYLIVIKSFYSIA